MSKTNKILDTNSGPQFPVVVFVVAVVVVVVVVVEVK